MASVCQCDEVDKIEFRPVAVNEQRAVSDTIRAALMTGPIADDVLEESRDMWEQGDYLAAWENDLCVGHVGAFHLTTTIPGGAQLSTAGVTEVGILPTHTRRGLLTKLITRLLREAHDAGTILASLRASEAPIYGRFGFALAGDAVAAVINTRRAQPLTPNLSEGNIRLVNYRDVRNVVPPIYDKCKWRSGTVSRPSWKWPWILHTASRPTETRHGKGVFVAAHTGSDGEHDGYVHYEVEWDEDFADNPTGKGKIVDLWGATPEIELSLWNFVLGIDLVLVWEAEPRPVDDPIRRAMYDCRAYETRRRLDEQWVRLLDVDAALSERQYGATDRTVTLEIQDPMFEENCGRWTISGTGAQRTDAKADLCVDITSISAAYLGGVAWQELAACGALPSSPPEVLADLDALFRIYPAPFSGTMF